MFSPVSVCQSDCLVTGLLKNYLSNLYEILRNGLTLSGDQSPLSTIKRRVKHPVQHGMTRPSPSRNTVLPGVTSNPTIPLTLTLM